MRSHPITNTDLSPVASRHGHIFFAEEMSMPSKPPSSFPDTVYERDRREEHLFIGAILTLATLAIGYLFWCAQPVAQPLPSPYVKVVTNAGYGSGVSIGDGYILTAAHVLVDPFSPGRQLEASVKTDDGVIQPATVLWSNTDYDVALVSVSEHKMQSATLDCSPTHVGDEVKAYGNPVDLEFIFTKGVVSGPEIAFKFWPSSVPLSIAVGPGQSGGGVINSSGKVAGIAVASIASDYGAIAIGIMVPSTAICHLLARD